MVTLRTIAFVGFMLVAVLLAVNGIWYLASKRIMSYHCKAMGKPWEDLSAGTQVMSLCFMKSAAAGMLSSGIAIMMLLIFPYRMGELWSEITVSLIALLEQGFITSRVAVVRKRTQGNPPLAFSLAICAAAVISTLLTFLAGC